MKKSIIYLLLFIFAGISFASCNDEQTYAEQKERERNIISAFVHGTTNVAAKVLTSPINIISESVFHAQGDMTNVERNEYVLFESTGVYMQIVQKGCGEILQKNESATVLCRFDEYNLMADSLVLSNKGYSTHYFVDKFSVRNVSGSFYASFDQNSSLMYLAYSSASVPAGWLVPLSYIKLGRLVNEGDELAKVRLIIPHDQGHSNAASGVYPCFYEITYQRQ